MKKFVIDRIENGVAVCENNERQRIEINVKDLPKNAKEGSVIAILDNGETVLDIAETESRRKRLLKKQRRVFGEKN